MLSKNIHEYIEAKRTLGFKFRVQSSLLWNYCRFAQSRNELFVRSQTVLEWANLAPSPEQKRNRLLTIRRFAIDMQLEDTRYEIPPGDVFGHQESKRKIRHLFSRDDIQKLLQAALHLTPQGSIRPKTYTTVFALLAATGMRPCEVIALNITDFCDDGLFIRSTKYRKDRLVPLHPSSQSAMQLYLSHRIKLSTDVPAFFISNTRDRLSYGALNSTFLKLMRSIGLRGAPGKPGACLHDLRHSFAVNSLEQCSGSYACVSRHMLALSTYLGHAHLSDTFWYLQSTPMLLAQISQAQAKHFGRSIK